MCCSFWEKCKNSPKTDLGCSTPLNIMLLVFHLSSKYTSTFCRPQIIPRHPHLPACSWHFFCIVIFPFFSTQLPNVLCKINGKINETVLPWNQNLKPDYKYINLLDYYTFCILYTHLTVCPFPNEITLLRIWSLTTNQICQYLHPKISGNQGDSLHQLSWIHTRTLAFFFGALHWAVAFSFRLNATASDKTFMPSVFRWLIESRVTSLKRSWSWTFFNSYSDIALEVAFWSIG